MIADFDHADDATGAEIVELRPTREQTNERLDRFVASAIPDLSRTYIQHLIETGHVTVDGAVRKPKFKMTPGEIVTVVLPPPATEEIEPEAIPLSIVYEDADLIVLDKPAGLVVHPAPGHPRGTLVNALLHHAPEMAVGGTNRPGIVHRLDKETSGLMVVAKSDRGRTALTTQWAERSVRKRYVALVAGIVEPDEATIDAPIGRDHNQRQRMAVVRGGRDAVTHLTVRQRFADATLVDLEIETGRTHQIRVHLAFIGHPVVGDPLYGCSSTGERNGAPRQLLHASGLAFRLPDGRSVSFTSELPEDFVATVERLESAGAS